MEILILGSICIQLSFIGSYLRRILAILESDDDEKGGGEG
jgi:hypothetical protein